MSDNPMYWPGHQRPSWPQQPPSGQPMNTMSHYPNHPSSMLASGMPGDPSVQMQSSIPGRHQPPHQSALSQHPSTLTNPGAQSNLYSSMMPASGGPGSARPASQLTPNSHLPTTPTQGLATHSGMQQSTHQQSHYPQYSSYWNPPPIGGQTNLSGPGSAAAAASNSQTPNQVPSADNTGAYHASSGSPLTMSNDARGNISSNTPASMQQATPSFHSPKDIQSSNEHMITYDRQRNPLPQQQHSTAIMSQNVPSSAASNLSPTQSQMSMQSRLQSQTQLDTMRSISQQPSAVPGWSSGYYAQPNQTPYTSVINPYMPYGGSSAVQNHSSSTVGQPPSARPPMNQKPSSGSERVHAPYPTHAPIYGQPPPSVPGSNGSYYGYESYYNQMTSQAPDPYLSHSTTANASQHWAGSNQIISNSSVPQAAPSQPPPLRPQPGLSSSSLHPQSPSSSSSLPMSRPPVPPPAQTPERSPAATLSTSYPSPNQQGQASKSTSNSLAQLEQMVMPNSGQTNTNSTKSPTHRSSTSSPSTNTQQQMQYSYNSSGQGSYFSNSGANAAPNQGIYYPHYESSNIEMQKPGWSEQQAAITGPMMNPIGTSSGSVMIEGGQSAYGQPGYDNTGYGEYTTLSTPSSQSRFPPAGESGEVHNSDKSDPYAIDSQTFDDYDEQSTTKGKKSRAKKGDEKVKKERKPRAPRAPKNSTNFVPQPSSPAARAALQQPMPQPNDISPVPQNTSPHSFSSPNQQISAPIRPLIEAQSSSESTVMSMNPPDPATPIKSPVQRLSTDSPNLSTQQVQYSYNTNQPPSYYQNTPSVAPNQTSYYASYESTASPQKLWSDQPQMPQASSAGTPQPTMTDKSHYNSSGLEGNNTYSEYTTLPSAASGVQCAYPQTIENKQEESNETAVEEPAIESRENSTSSKIKKSRAKKSDDKPKKERKPRAPKGAKSGANTSAAGSPNSSQVSISIDASSVSPNSQSFATDFLRLPPQSESNPTTNEDQSGVQAKSPATRLSTDSPSLSDQHSQPQYGSGENTRVSFYTSETGRTSSQAGFYPNYDANADAQKSWTGPGPATSSSPIASSTSMAIEGGSLQNYENSFSSLNSSMDAVDQTKTSAFQSDPRFTPEPQEVQTRKEGDANLASTPKPKKSRAKKSEGKNKDKDKRDRKSKVPKVEQAPVEVSETPVSLDETLEAQSSQPISDAVTPEAKPKRIRIRDASSKGKKKLPKFALKFAKTKKRKRLGSSDNDQSDLDKTPPPSPDEVESGVQKRRSARNTKKLKYNDDIALGFSDSDDESQILSRTKKASEANMTNDGEVGEETMLVDEPTVFAAPVEDTMVVEKIMASRTGRRELEPEPGEILPPDGTFIDVEEFYVKYKNLSHLHCDWRTLEELERGDRRVAQKIKRYKQKKDSSNMFSFMDEEPFDPQYCEVDRILAMNEVEEEVPESDAEEGDINNTVNETSMESEKKNTLEVKDGQSNLEPQDPESKTETATEVDESVAEKTPKENTSVVVPSSSPIEPEVINESNKSQDEDNTANVEHNEELIQPKMSEEVTPASGDQSISDTPIKEKSDEPQDTIEPDRPKKMKKKISRHFLVKWRGLSYEESTWELEDHLDPEKIKHFLRFKDPPPKSKWRHVKRPKPEEWVRKEVSPVYKNNNTLREYQLEGINWLSFCWHQGRNCILADEMGLGKTIQSIAFVNEIYERGINGPFLIIVPLSTVGNWAREFETWTDLNVITYHGSSTSREMLKEYEMFYRNEQGNRITSYYKFQVMITTFEIILSDCLDLREIPWRCCIIDEAHRLKNRNCKLLEGLRLLNMEHRVLLTGTPLQNNVEELFSLLNFLEPNQFSSTEQFLQEFGDLKTEAQVDKLKLILKPMMLRRLKEDVEKTLAPKEETIVEVELTNIQKKYYRAILEKNFSFLSKGSTSNNMPNLMNTMMELRKCCIHPYLINGAEEQIMYEARQTKTAGGEPMSSQQALINSSGKLVLIDKLLPRLKADGHRVLIFSQMVRCLDILEDYVTHKHYPFERIDGRVRGSDRQQAIDRFSKPGSDRFVFLLCTRAGGLGINLTAADTVIIFDSDWNPQNDLQAQARCHRIGQSKAVKIYRLICRNTYEREMFDKASLKLGLDKAVLQSMNTQKGGSGGIDGQLTKKEIEELLRKGAYGALMDDDNAGDKFCEEDIDHILQRRTQVITIDNSEAKGSTFSKATFSSSNNREDIELDDPNFWEKWAKKANIDADEHDKDELIQLAPRRRTQTKRYGADGNLIDMSDLESSEEDEETISMRTRGSRGRQPKLTPSSSSKRNKRKFLDFEDDDFLTNLDGGYWSKGDCLKIEKGLLTYGWGRWDKIISSNKFKRDISVDDCENICRVILLYCLKSYKGDEKIKSFAWELITPLEEASKSQSDLESVTSTRGRKPKSCSSVNKRSVADEISESSWPKEAKYDPLIALPDDQYRRHLQRNCNRLLIRVKFLHYLKNDILKGYEDKIINDCDVAELELPSVPVDGELPAHWWDDDSDKSLLIGIFKHGHDKFNLMRQDPSLCFLSRCGPPNKEELIAELNSAERSEDLDEEGRVLTGSKDSTRMIIGHNNETIYLRESDTGIVLDDLVDHVARDFSDFGDSKDIVDENKNSIMKCSDQNDSIDESFENGITESSQTAKMDITDEDDSLTNEESIIIAAPAKIITEDNGEFLPFPSANDLNQRFRRLVTAYQRNSKKLEIKLAQKARDELKKERTSKFEAARNEREERKRFLAQKWSRREEADFFRAISSFGVEYDPVHKRHDWNKFRSLGKLDKKLDDTLEEYYKAFVIMCKRATSRPLTVDEEKCPINVDAITEERASKCLIRIEFLSKIREQTITHPNLDERLRLCPPQNDLPDWWEIGKHDKDLLLAAAKHGLTRLDYNLAHDPQLSFTTVIRQKAQNLINQPPTSIFIPLEQMQELLDRNGIEYSRDFELNDDAEEISTVLFDIISSIESSTSKTDGMSFAELVDGPHSLTESSETSLLALSNTPQKLTRSSSQARALPSIISRRNKPDGLHLTPVEKPGRSRVVEITPILPDNLPEELTKSFEAGEITVTILSESALVKLDDREPIILAGATNPVNVKIRWPRDKAIQTRLENLVAVVEKGEWPSPPKPSLPTITLPNPIPVSLPPAPINVATSSSSKNDRSDFSLGSPKSDISNVSKQETKDSASDLTTSRNRRGRGRKPRQLDNDSIGQDLDSPKDDQTSTAKLRNLLSQAPSSKSASPSSDKFAAKFGNSKQSGGLSSLLASFKQKTRNDGSSSSRNREEQGSLDLNAMSALPNNLLPQILANLKPEFRDLLANPDAATMLLNSLTSNMAGGKNLAANLKSGGQFSLDNLLNPRSSSSKGPPPAHQRADNAPPAHSNSTRELRRNSTNTGQNSPPSFNLRSTRGRCSVTNLDNLTNQKSVESQNPKPSNSKKRGRPSSATSESSAVTPADVLDLSSLDTKGSTPRQESRSRRSREYSDDTSSQLGAGKLSQTTKSSSKSASKGSTEEPESGRTTRASKRMVGSRIDALALNLQAKRMNRGDSPTAESPSSPRSHETIPSAAHDRSANEGKSNTSEGPPAAHSSSQKQNSSDRRNKNTNQSNVTATTLPSTSALRPETLTQFMSNPLLSGLNPSALGASGDMMNQLLRKAGSNDIVKNLLNEFIKNPSLALDPNVLNTLSASLSLGPQSFPGFNLPNQPTTAPMQSTTTKTTASSLLNDFKSPSGSSIMKRAKTENSSSRITGTGGSNSPSTHRSSSEKQERRSASSERRSSNYQDRHDKSGKSDKRSSGNTQPDPTSDNSLRRSSSSLLAHQIPPNSQTNPVSTSATPSSVPSPLASSANSMNLVNQFGNLNSLGGLLGFPGMNELMKQMSSFPGLATSGLPRVSGQMITNPSSISNTTSSSGNDKSSRRSRQSSGASTVTTPAVTSQQAANAALNSFMNLASQAPSSTSSAYGNYTNPLANPFLPFNLANLGMSNPLGMGLFPGLYMPGFPAPDQQQSQTPTNQSSSNSNDGGSKEKKLRYPRK